MLLFTGKSGSGKSTIARTVSETIDAPIFAEREIFRSLAHAHGFSRGRLWLESVGIVELLKQAREKTIELLAAVRDEPIAILDGVYDAALPEAIRQKIPNAVLRIVSVTAPIRVRRRRVAERLGTTSLREAGWEITFLDAMKNAAGMGAIVRNSWVTIRNMGTVQESSAVLLSALAALLPATAP